MKIILPALLLVLCGCSLTTETRPPLRLSDEQIKSTNDAALCSLNNTMIDPRISGEITSRKIDCDPVALTCAAKGIKKRGKAFEKCQADQRFAAALNYKKMSNPAYGYCLDSGFHEGTNAMATCIASWNQQRQHMYALDEQSRLIEREQDALAHQRRMERMYSEDNKVKLVMPTFPNIVSPVPRSTQTQCQNNGAFGVTCTTY